MSIPLLGPEDDSEDLAESENRLQRIFEKHAYTNCRSVDEYKKGKEIGRGNYGVVFEARHKETDELFALKKFKLSVNDSNGIPIGVYREICFLRDMHHENIIKLVDVVVGSKLESIFLVMEHCKDNLADVMKKMQIPFSQDEIKCIMTQLLTALDYIHERGVVHRDINPSNVLLTESAIVKICDFGSAKSEGAKPMSPEVGTRWYHSPEQLFGSTTYGTGTDMWAAGCIFAELLKHVPLFPGNSDVEQIMLIVAMLGTPNDTTMPGFSEFPVIQSFELNQQPYNYLRKEFKNLCESGLVLLKRMLLYDQGTRIRTKDCLASDYFKENPVACTTSKLQLGIIQKKLEDSSGISD